ncbi:MAG: hypothetical protein IPK19_28440 [Chloroflexi bacterium]|nr:hypothetical protein [Chloroflexota bacterium]
MVSIDRTKTEAIASSDYAKKLEDEQSRLVAELQAHVLQLKEARDGQARLSSLLQAQDSQMLAVQSAYDSLKDEHASLLRQFKALEENRGNERAIASRRQAELIQENELLLLQLRQVQEELEYRVVQESENSESSNSSKEEQARLATEQQSRIQQLTADLAAQTTLMKGYQTKVQGLAVELDEQTQMVAARQTAIGQLTAALDEQNGLAATRQTAIEQLTKALDEQTGLAAARQAAVQATDHGSGKADRSGGPDCRRQAAGLSPLQAGVSDKPRTDPRTTECEGPARHPAAGASRHPGRGNRECASQRLSRAGCTGAGKRTAAAPVAAGSGGTRTLPPPGA